MVTIQDPTVAYAHVVSQRRRARADRDAEHFRLGVHGLDCGSLPSSERRAVIGASAWALKAEQVEHTVELIGTIGGLLADLGFTVCPIGADGAGSQRPSIVLWVCGDDTADDEYEQLLALGVPGVSIGSCVYGLDTWTFIETADVEDRRSFIPRFVEEVDYVLSDENVSNNLSNEPRRIQPHDAGRSANETDSDLHEDGRSRTSHHPPRPGSSGS